MACLLKVLSDMLQNPQPLSHIHICPKPKAKTGHTDSSYPAPPISSDTTTAKTLNSSVSPMGSRPHRDGLANALRPIATISVSPSMLDQYLVCLLPKSVPPSLCNRSNRVEVLP